MKVLVIEDEILIQQSLKKMLEIKKALVDTTASGQEAISLIKNNEYDRIVCDLMLKDITGFDIIEESKSIFSKDEISKKFIIITAYSSGQVLKRANSYDCILLNKPFNNIQGAINTIITGENK